MRLSLSRNEFSKVLIQSEFIPIGYKIVSISPPHKSNGNIWITLVEESKIQDENIDLISNNK